MNKNEKRMHELTKLISRLRRDPRLWDDDDRVYKLIGKALKRRAHLLKVNDNIGPYSGLTRSELQRSRTCETDWY